MSRWGQELPDGRRIEIEANGNLKSQAEWLLGLLARLERDKSVLRDGARIQVGWVLLTVRESAGVVSLLGPSFGRDPLRELTRDLSVPLEVQAKQNDVLRTVGVEGEPVSFCDKVVLAKGVLGKSHIYLERTADRSEGDSGWYIGAVDEDASHRELEARMVFELLELRPALLQVLALPSGHLVVFRRDAIEAVLNPEDQNLWPTQVI